MIGGSTNGVTTDGTYNLAKPCIVDQFEKAGISWKAYQENYPGGCYTSDSSPYVRCAAGGFTRRNLRSITLSEWLVRCPLPDDAG